MKHIWSIFCRNLLEDKVSNNPSLIDITEQIGFRGELPDERPVVLPFSFPFVVVSNWWRDNDNDRGKYPCRLRFISPDNDQLTQIEFEVDLEATTGIRTFGHISQLPYTRNGIYEFEVSYQSDGSWQVAARIPLQIIHEPPEPEHLESEPAE